MPVRPDTLPAPPARLAGEGAVATREAPKDLDLRGRRCRVPVAGGAGGEAASTAALALYAGLWFLLPLLMAGGTFAILAAGGGARAAGLALRWSLLAWGAAFVLFPLAWRRLSSTDIVLPGRWHLVLDRERETLGLETASLGRPAYRSLGRFEDVREVRLATLSRLAEQAPGAPGRRCPCAACQAAIGYLQPRLVLGDDELVAVGEVWVDAEQARAVCRVIAKILGVPFRDPACRRFPGARALPGARPARPGEPGAPPQGAVRAGGLRLRPGACGAICGEEAGEGALRCTACETLHHPDCWEYNRGCAIFGCPRQPGPAARAEADAQDWWGRSEELVERGVGLVVRDKPRVRLRLGESHRDLPTPSPRDAAGVAIAGLALLLPLAAHALGALSLAMLGPSLLAAGLVAAVLYRQLGRRGGTPDEGACEVPRIEDDLSSEEGDRVAGRARRARRLPRGREDLRGRGAADRRGRARSVEPRRVHRRARVRGAARILGRPRGISWRRCSRARR